MARQQKDSMKERVLRTLRGEGEGGVVWQPRIYYWYYGNRLQNQTPPGYEDDSVLQSFYENIDHYPEGEVPDRFREMTMLEIYDHLGASPRYPQETLGVSLFQGGSPFSPEIIEELETKVSYDEESGEKTTIYETPWGDLRKVTSGYTKEYPIKNTEDMEITKKLLRRASFQFDRQGFRVAQKAFGDRGPVQTFHVRSPLQSLITEHMGFERTFLTLHRHRTELEELLEEFDRWHDRVWDVLLDSPIEVFNFGENIDQHFDSPPIFKDYLYPYYEKRIDAIHRRGKLCHIHVDGSFKQLIPLLAEADFDGLEALTPRPQGDVSLEEMEQALGGKVLLDGLPATLFTPEYSFEELEEFTLRVLNKFSPDLILGISDELPPTGNIEKVELVSELVAEFNG